jgi:predicted PurR-regulated permease PerM
MPNPMLWGTMAGVLNFIPYVGNLFGVGVITLAAALTFDQVSIVAMVGGTYLLVTAVEGNFVVPYILGHKMSLNPVVILLSVFFWGWLWGALGAWLAVPILASVKIVCDHIESLNSLGEFLGQ